MLSHQHLQSFSSSCATIRVSSSHLHLHELHALHLHELHAHPYGSAFCARLPPEALQYQIPKSLQFLLMANMRPYHHPPSYLSLTQSSIEASPSNESSSSSSSSSRKQGHRHRSYRIQRTITTSDNAAVNPNAIRIAANSNGVINKDVSSIPGIIYPPATTVGKSTNIVWQTCMAKKAERQKLIGQKGCVVWITGLSGSGKSTLACAFEHALMDRGKLSYILDGDNLRHGLNNNLGFSAEDRTENIRRVGEVAKLFVDAGIICIASLISPYKKDRDACRKLLEEGEFIEVYMNFPLQLCEERDPKGLYKLARAGKIRGFTGIDDPYEPPSNCEIVMEPTVEGRCPTPSEMAEQLISYLEERFFFAPPP